MAPAVAFATTGGSDRHQPERRAGRRRWRRVNASRPCRYDGVADASAFGAMGRIVPRGWGPSVWAARPTGRGGSSDTMIKEFRDFLTRGNVLDLAVAVIVGAAFTAIVDALVADVITPILGIFGGTPDFSAVTFEINDSEFRIGAFINTVIQFLLTGLVLFFVIVKPMNEVLKRRTQPATQVTTQKWPACLSDIPIGATRCAFCTTELDGGGRLQPV